ncbi:TatD family hydrolase [Mycoplasma sp. ES3157-GEN-MYC]|uniref:TatD family hydrolase n=1 Tax=Mycoplasma miroungigenitalium TaxID=754515 RepID=A0A6M4JF69_9MOLU|nr:TatD family hydrolase [Mycoplasma miroungigenitalium]MBU4690240.1 TatD family hydrolase [Mycoplasma miroungigenitalium]MBU4691507.1 TatD family hydrolase [Mycoplasma miroungigenitalium]QJR43341.1 TatD family hydrolase [Mycoplasma miroungigenitalium]
MAIKFVDAHTHPLKEYYKNTDETIMNAFNEGVEIMMVTGCSLDENNEVIATCKKYDFTYPVIGIHPNHATGDIDGLNLEKQITSDVKAIGEIGLDFFWDLVPKEIQISSLHSQIKVAQKYNLPVVIHMRDSYEELYEILKQYQEVKFMIHTFSGDIYWAKKFSEFNTYFSISGVSTYKNAQKTIEVVDWLPLDRILTETDAPYLSPANKRGTDNVSENVIYTTMFLAGIKKMAPEKFSKQVVKNAKEFFNLNVKR